MARDPMMGHDTRGNIGHLTNTGCGTRGAADAPPYAAGGPARPGLVLHCGDAKHRG
jgi:hypothetical protein